MATAGSPEARIFFAPQAKPVDEFIAHQDAGNWLYVEITKADVDKFRDGATVHQMAGLLCDRLQDAPEADVRAASRALELMASLPFVATLKLFEIDDEGFALVLPGSSTGEEMTHLRVRDIAGEQEHGDDQA